MSRITTEKVLCSAIWYKEQPTSTFLPVNITYGTVVCGHRHNHCIHTFVSLTGKRSVTIECGAYESGFITNINRFVGRKEALVIALRENQVLDINNLRGNRLYSEDLY